MKKILIMLIILIPTMVWSQGRISETSGPSPYVNFDELKTLMENDNLILIDVRTEAEYNSGHIPGSINIPYDTMPSSMPKDSKDSEIIVYCRSGNRSGIARNTLTKAGYTNIRDFGAIGNWKAGLE